MTFDDYVDQLVDEDALAAYLTTEIGPAEDYELERFSGGHSNETLFLTWNQTDLVLRRPPAGETADNAHDVLREYHVMDALQDTAVHVPRTILACEDDSIIGSEFYLMERERGDVLRERELDRFATPATRRRVGRALVDRLADIHTVDYDAVGLAEFGRPDGYLTRQVDRWHDQYEWACEVTADERSIPAMDVLYDWLSSNVPDTSPSALVHGDYKLDNVIFGRDSPPEIVGIVDWEMSTLGDPLTDLGWLLSYWRDPADSPCAIPELIPAFTERDGYPTKRELVSRYESRTGLEFSNSQFYRGLAVFKFTAVCEMFFRRHLDGNADDSLYPKMRDRVPAMADWGVRIIDGDEPL